jgi:hypothetical protein
MRSMPTRIVEMKLQRKYTINFQLPTFNRIGGGRLTNFVCPFFVFSLLRSKFLFLLWKRRQPTDTYIEVGDDTRERLLLV